MKIISHRGFWVKPEEKNSTSAFVRSVNCGFGIETDIRDYNGEIIISHDIPDKKELSLEDFCQIPLIDKYPLALNIKSDGLAIQIKSIMSKYNLTNWFVFDMSIPDTLSHVKCNNNFFFRLSEYEPESLLYQTASGIWLDAFLDEWYNQDLINKHIESGKSICIVSSELHGRDYKTLWDKLYDFRDIDQLYLCTDLPMEAKLFFS